MTTDALAFCVSRLSAAVVLTMMDIGPLSPITKTVNSISNNDGKKQIYLMVPKMFSAWGVGVIYA